MASGKSNSSTPSDPTVRPSVVTIPSSVGWTDPWSALAEELIASGQEHLAEEVIRDASRLAPDDGRVQHLRRRLAGA